MWRLGSRRARCIPPSEPVLAFLQANSEQSSRPASGLISSADISFEVDQLRSRLNTFRGVPRRGGAPAIPVAWADLVKRRSKNATDYSQVSRAFRIQVRSCGVLSSFYKAPDSEVFQYLRRFSHIRS